MLTLDVLAAVGAAARAHKLPEANLAAVVDVESNGVIFADIGDRKEPLIRFEGHWFDRLIDPAKRDAARAAGLANPKVGGVKNPKAQKARWDLVERAAAIDSDAAYESCSYGVGQVMGLHWKKLGFKTVKELVELARSGVQGQVDLMVRFIVMSGLDDELRDGRWAAFARGYNGPKYKTNSYDTKLQRAAALYGGSRPVTDGFLRMGAKGAKVRDLQTLLVRAGHAVKVDGDFGIATRDALKAFQKSQGLTVDGVLGPQTERALGNLRQPGEKVAGTLPAVQIKNVQAGLATAIGGTMTIETAKSTLEQAATQIAAAGIKSQLIDMAVSGLTVAAGVLAVAGVAYAGYAWWKSHQTAMA